MLQSIPRKVTWVDTQYLLILVLKYYEIVLSAHVVSGYMHYNNTAPEI